MIGIKAAAKANKNGQVGLLGLLNYRLDPVNIQINWFFAVDGLPCLNGAAQQVGMGVGGGGDQHCIHIGCPDFLRAGSYLRAQLRRQLLCRRRIDIIDICQFSPGMIGNICAMNFADKPAPNCANLIILYLQVIWIRLCVNVTLVEPVIFLQD